MPFHAPIVESDHVRRSIVHHPQLGGGEGIRRHGRDVRHPLDDLAHGGEVRVLVGGGVVVMEPIANDSPVQLLQKRRLG